MDDLTQNQQNLVDITLIVLRNRYTDEYLRVGGAERHISAVLRSVAALIDRSKADDIEIARRALYRHYGVSG